MAIQLPSRRYEILYRAIKSLGDKSNRSYLILDSDFNIAYCNELYSQLTNFQLSEIAYRPFQSFVYNTKGDNYITEIQKRLQQGKITKAEILHKKNKGKTFFSEIECYPFQNEIGETQLVLLFVKDSTYIQIYELMNRLEQEMFGAIQRESSFFEQIQLICNGMDEPFSPHCLTTIAIKEKEQIHIMSSDQFGEFQKINYVLKDPMEIATYESLIGNTEPFIDQHIEGTHLHAYHKEFARSRGLNGCVHFPISQQNSESLGVITIYFGKKGYANKPYIQLIDKVVDLIFLAYTYEKKQQEIYQLAYIDPYTGIVNREGFIKRIKELGSQRQNGVIKILEPSEFSRIVELYGRAAGQEVLKQLFERFLKESVHRSIIIGRFSSSSLVLYTTRSEDRLFETEVLLKKLVEQPFVINDQRIYISIKCGIAIFKKQDYLNDSIRHAESALTAAKGHAGTFISYYQKRTDEQLEKEMHILNHLNEAVKNKELMAYFQPKVELRRGRIVSMEALARWYSSKLGFVSPADFIPIAERAGLIREIDLQIIEQVLIWFQQRQYKGKRIVPIAINISPEHFYHPKFVEQLEDLVKKYYADPNYLIIEITENLGLEDIERAQKIIRELFVRGFKTSVDDFGIGYSSLSYLQKLMFSELKIDRSFTSRIHEAGTYAIVRSIIQIAYNLEISVVAEGVETEEQAEVLQQLGCDYAQGFLYHKPMSIEEIEDKRVLDA
ncbi:EAL domain-containing protein [Lysinibacillus sp. 54212]|uniref:EAL domain-containing protein n=1 Tax=Lysinibacillus sp. 54212 TaxID=3119829 RepID=UPI002FCBADA7